MNRRGASVLLVVALVLAVRAPFVAAQQGPTVRFSNWEFTPPPMMEKAEQTTDKLVFKLDKSVPGPGGTLTLEAGRPLQGTLAARLDAEWRRLTKGRKLLDVKPDNQTELMDGSEGLAREATTANGGSFAITVFSAPNHGVNLLQMDAADDMATQMLGGTTVGFFMSIKLHPVGGSALAQAAPGKGDEAEVGAPKPLGPDLYASAMAKGNGVNIRTSADLDELNVDKAFASFVSENQALLGRAPNRTTSFEGAMRKVEALVDVERNADYLQRLRADPHLQSVEELDGRAVGHMLAQSPEQALAALLVAQQHWPQDPGIMFNLASLLAQQGFAAESQAILDEIERRKKLPYISYGIKPRSVMDYLHGYNLMSMGDYEQASQKLQDALNQSPGFGEAALSLALVNQKRGGSGKWLFVGGYYRRGTGRVPDAPQASYDGGAASYRDKTDVEVMDVGDGAIGLQAKAFLDLTKGQPGILPAVPRPAEVEDFMAYWYGYAAMQPALKSRAVALVNRRDQLNEKWRSGVSAGPRLEYYEAILRIFDEANARVVELQPMIADREDARSELSDADDRVGARFSETMADIARRYAGQPPVKACPETRKAIAEAQARLMPYVHKLDLAERRVHRLWHQYATALGGIVDDPNFRSYLQADVQLADEVAYQWLLQHVIEAAKFSAGYETCIELERRQREEEATQQAQLAPCDEKKKVTRGYKLIFLKFERSCEGMSLSIVNDLLPGLELTGEAKFDRNGWLKEHKISGSLEGGGGKLSGEITTDKSGGFKEGKIGGELGAGVGDVVKAGDTVKGEVSVDSNGSMTFYGADKVGGSVEAGPVKGEATVEVGEGFTVDAHGHETGRFTKTATERKAEVGGVGGSFKTETVTRLPGPTVLPQYSGPSG